MYIFDLAIAIKVVLDNWTLVPQQCHHKHSLPSKALSFQNATGSPNQNRPSV